MSHEAGPATHGEGAAPEISPGLQPLADATAQDIAAIGEASTDDRFSADAIWGRLGAPWREPKKGFRAIAAEIAAVAALARARATAPADRDQRPLPSAQQETTMDTAGQHGSTFNPDTYGTANGAEARAPQPSHGSDIDALNRRISDLERHAYGQAGGPLDEHAEATSRETFGDAEVAARAYDADVRQQIGSLRQVLGLQVMLLIQSVHAGAAEVAGNPSAIGAADEAFAQAQDAIGGVRAALAALADLPPLVSAPLSSEDLASRFALQQSLCVDRIAALIWQLRSYSDLIQNRPLNVPATVSVERTLHDISADVQTLTSGFGLIREEVLRRMASEQRPSPQPAGAA